jgi:glycosyltransferase involved in cell wall biosynthesis
VFLFPSDVETFGNVTLEALASGCPCVVEEKCGGHLVTHGVNGFTCPAGIDDIILYSQILFCFHIFSHCNIFHHYYDLFNFTLDDQYSSLGDFEAFYQATKRVVQDVSMRKQMAQKAREGSWNFERHKIMQQMLENYKVIYSKRYLLICDTTILYLKRII